MLPWIIFSFPDGAFRLLDIRTKVSSYIWDKLEMPPISWHCKERGKGDQTNARILWVLFPIVKIYNAEVRKTVTFQTSSATSAQDFKILCTDNLVIVPCISWNWVAQFFFPLCCLTCRGASLWKGANLCERKKETCLFSRLPRCSNVKA